MADEAPPVDDVKAVEEGDAEKAASEASIHSTQNKKELKVRLADKPESQEKPTTNHVFLARNIHDLKDPEFWKAGLAEVLGTLILVFVGCAVCLDDWQVVGGNASVVQISLSFGLAVATAVWCIGHISGGNINPAITIPMLLTRKMTLARAVVYVIAQCLGAIAGAAILHGIRVQKYYVI